MIPAALTGSLVEIVGSDAVVVDADRLLVYESDALTAYRHRPGAVVLPRTTAQTRRVVRAIARHGLPIVPRGAGTGLSGGAVALDGAVVVGTARMNRILEIDAANRRAVLQPGVINAELSVAARPHGLHYAPDPSSQTACTIGGNVAENSGGPHCLKYGVTSRYVTGLTVVLADGSAVRLGGRGREAPGYDLVGLFVGSEGCFGIATEIEVGLLPLPEGVRTLLGIFERIEDAGRAVSGIVSAGLLPAAMEIIDGPTIRAVEESVFAAGYPTDAEAALVIEFDGVEAGLDADAARAAEHCTRAGAREVRSARDEPERMALWKGRKKAFGAIGRIAPDLLVQDATVPRTTLPSILKGISEIAGRYRLVVANVFHAGDGNLHPNILFDRRDRDEVERVERASREIMRLCVDSGGTITGEHGVGLDKKHHMPLVHGPAELEAMWGLRRVFDPAGAMNPGKVLPDGAKAARTGDEARRRDTGGVRGAARAAAASGGVLGLLPADRVLSGGAARAWAGGFPAEGVVFPGGLDEVCALVRAAADTGTRLLPAGRGSWLWAGGWAGGGAVIVSTDRLNAVSRYEPADLTLTAGAGIGWGELDGVLRPNRQWLPVDAPGVGAGTLGGAVACGVSGPLRARYGAARDNVLGLEVVTGDGRVLRVGGRVVKNVAGYDLVRLFTGSRGSLGVITGVSIRLFPRPDADATLFFEGGETELLAMAGAVRSTSLPVAAGEVAEVRGGSRADRTGLAVRVLGGRAEAEEVCSRLEREIGAAPGEVLWDGASEIFHGRRAGWEGEAPMVARLAALPDRLGETLALAREVAAEVGGEVAADVLSGLVRVKGYPPAEELPALAESLSRARRAMRNAGGAMTLSQAPGELAARVGWTGDPGTSATLTGRIKSLFDPRSILSSESP
ncbi:MAG: FAD-binding protein [Gemmatimonadota bacterium]|nr:FAD-binding protein [Gemmatimonadota bacterium]